jgi:segregation and condensation protein B
MEEQNNIQNNNVPEINLESKIESLLFYKGDSMKIKELAKIFEVSEKEISTAIINLKQQLESRGVQISEKEDSVVLVTSKEASDIIEKIRKEELTKDLSKAALETLSIIMYRGPIKRSEIDYIRGVNSQFILRLLLVRGLIEKVTNPKDERGYLYKATFELLNMLGVNKIEEIPEFKSVNEDIDGFIQNKEEADKEEI